MSETLATNPMSEAPVLPPPSGMRAWHPRLAVVIGAITTLIAAAVLVSSFTLAVDPPQALISLIYLGVFVLTALLTDRVEDGNWTGFPHVVAMLAWLTLGLNAALLIVLVGAALTALIQLRAHRLLDLDRLTPYEAISLALGRIAITGVSLAVAAGVYRALNFAPPLNDLTLNNMIALLVALLGALVTTQFIGVLLLGDLRDVGARLRWARKQGQALLELVSIVVIIVLALLKGPVPYGVYAALLALIALEAVRTRDTRRSAGRMRRIEALSLLRETGETTSSLMMDDLLLSIYQQVYQVTGAPVIAFALYNAEHGILDYRLVMVNGEKTVWPVRRMDDSAASYVIRHGKTLPLNTHERETLEQLGIAPSLMEQLYPHLLGLPLAAGDETLGALILVRNGQYGQFDADTLATLDALARQAGLAIHNARLYSRSTELVEHLSLINSAMQTMIHKLDKTQAIQKISEAAVAIGQADASGLYLLNRVQRTTELVHAIGLNNSQQTAYTSYPQVIDIHRQNLRLLTDVEAPSADQAIVRLARQGGFRALTEIPLLSNNAVLGYLTLYYNDPHYPSASELELLQMLANQVASVIDNAELFGALETYAFEMAQLAHLSRVSMLNLDLDTVVQDVAEILCQVLLVNRCTIALVDPSDNTLRVVGSVVTADRPPITTPDEQQIAFHEVTDVITQPFPSPRALHADDPTLSIALKRLMAVNLESTIAIIPMRMNNSLMGLILLGSQEKREFTEREWQLAEMATNQVGAQIQNARLYTTTQTQLSTRLDQLAMIEDIARQITSTLDFNQIIKNMLEAAIRSTQANYVALILLSEDQHLRVIVIDYTNGKFSRHFMPIPREDSIVGQVIRSGKPILTRDTRNNPNYIAPRTGTTYLSSLAVPLIRDNQVVGVLAAESERTNFFSEEHTSFLSNLAGHAVISIANARALDERQYQVNILTSLQSLALRLSSAIDTRSVASAVLDTAFDLFSPREAAIFRYNPQNDSLSSLASLRQDGDLLRGEAPLIPDDVVREAAQTGEVQIVQHTRLTNGNGKTGTLKTEPPHPGSTISVPLKRGNHVQEVLAVAFTEPRNFPMRDLETLSLLAGQAAGHLENAILHEQIRAGNERLAAILNSVRDGVIVLDQRGWLVEANPAARELLGEHLDTYVNEIIGEAVWKRRDPAAQRATGSLRATGTLAADTTTRRQFDVKTARGTVYLDEIGQPVVDAHNRAVGWLLVLRDVTEEKLLADYRDEITSMVVHDLRGPLASIISGIYLAQEELETLDENDFIRRTLKLSSDSANSLMLLVESLLDVARLEAREMPLRIEATPVPPLVERAVEALDATLQQTRVVLKQDIPTSLRPVDADIDVIVRVLINLLDNAIRHTPPGQEILVQAEPGVNPEEVLIRVADSGRGIAVEDRERIFERFKQASGGSTGSGRRCTGLGLTFVKLAIEAHGGRIWVEDENPLGGASFAFTLPITNRRRDASGTTS